MLRSTVVFMLSHLAPEASAILASSGEKRRRDKKRKEDREEMNEGVNLVMNSFVASSHGITETSASFPGEMNVRREEGKENGNRGSECCDRHVYSSPVRQQKDPMIMRVMARRRGFGCSDKLCYCSGCSRSQPSFFRFCCLSFCFLSLRRVICVFVLPSISHSIPFSLFSTSLSTQIINPTPVMLLEPPKDRHRPCIVLDLDETLVRFFLPGMSKMEWGSKKRTARAAVCLFVFVPLCS